MTDSAQHPWRYTRWGSVLLSADFLAALPLGILGASSALLSHDVRVAMPGVLLGVAGVGAAIATLVLTSLTVLLGTITPAYRSMLQQVPGGVAGVASPFRVVIWIAAFTTAWALIAAGFAPIAQGHPVWAFLLAAPAYFGLLWAVFGCVQVTEQLIYHLQMGDRADGVEERRTSLQSRSVC